MDHIKSKHILAFKMLFFHYHPLSVPGYVKEDFEDQNDMIIAPKIAQGLR